MNGERPSRKIEIIYIVIIFVLIWMLMFQTFRVSEISTQCNNYWIEMVEEKCPEAVNGGYQVDPEDLIVEINIEDLNIT